MPSPTKQYGTPSHKGERRRMTAQLKAQADALGMNPRYSPMRFLLEVMRDEARPLDVRMDAAKAVLPYIHPKLVAVHTTENDKARSHEQWVDEMSKSLGTDALAQTRLLIEGEATVVEATVIEGEE